MPNVVAAVFIITIAFWVGFLLGYRRGGNMVLKWVDCVLRQLYDSDLTSDIKRMAKQLQEQCEEARRKSREMHRID